MSVIVGRACPMPRWLKPVHRRIPSMRCYEPGPDQRRRYRKLRPGGGVRLLGNTPTATGCVRRLVRMQDISRCGLAADRRSRHFGPASTRPRRRCRGTNRIRLQGLTHRQPAETSKLETVDFIETSTVPRGADRDAGAAAPLLLNGLSASPSGWASRTFPPHDRSDHRLLA